MIRIFLIVTLLMLLLSGCGIKCEHEDTIVHSGQTAMREVEDEFGNRSLVPHRCVRGVWRRVEGSSAKVID